MKLHEVEVLDRERFGDHILLRYAWDGAEPEPGQFVMVRPASGLDPFLSRPLFVHDYEDGVASLLFEVRGKGTALLAGSGARLTISEPLGSGFDLGLDGPKPVALVGGGVWVAPLKLLARRLTRHRLPSRHLPRSPRHGVCRLRGPPRPQLPVRDAGADRWLTGRPRLVLDRLGDLHGYSALCVSGPFAMLAAAREASAGKVMAQLALRERMACADGSCHGCAVPLSDGRGYSRACVEGPVFYAEALAW